MNSRKNRCKETNFYSFLQILLQKNDFFCTNIPTLCNFYSVHFQYLNDFNA